MGYILTVLNLLLQSVVRMIFTLPIGVSSKGGCRKTETFVKYTSVELKKLQDTLKNLKM